MDAQLSMKKCNCCVCVRVHVYAGMCVYGFVRAFN